MLTSKRDYAKPIFMYKGVQIELCKHIRYLGIELSSVLGFRKHIETVSVKATKTAAALSRLMSNVGGPTPAEKRLLCVSPWFTRSCYMLHQFGTQHCYTQ